MADTTHWRDIYQLNVRTLQKLASRGLMNAENETAPLPCGAPSFPYVRLGSLTDLGVTR
jgi:hypothetical protein